MKKGNVFLASIIGLMLVFAGFNLVKAENGSDDIFDDDSSSDLSEVTDDISTSDIVESEDEVDSQRRNYVKRTISSGSGWIITGEKGALLNIHLISGYFDGGITSKGWIKAGKLKLKIESTENTESKKTFKIISREGVTGTLVLTRGTTYQTGFAVWTGEIDVKVGNETYDAKVNLAIEEKSLGEKKLKDERDKADTSATGTLTLGQESYDVKGKIESGLRRIELDISKTGFEGELVLEKANGMDYIGKLKIEEKEEDSKLEGKIAGTFKLEGTTLYGDIKFANKDGTESTGSLKIALSREVDVSEKSEDNSSDDSNDNSEDDKKEDRSGSNSGSDSKNRGFWKRFIDFFGA